MPGAEKSQSPLHLTPEQWAAIRKIYEYDTDQPPLVECGRRAAAQFGFRAPTRSAVSRHAIKHEWRRHGSMTGIVEAAQRKADHVVAVDGSLDAGAGTASALSAYEARVAAEDKRAEVLARHRSEWQQVAVLRQEAVKARRDQLDEAAARARFAKVIAETTKLQQDGERRAWGLDEVLAVPDMSRLSDEQLRGILAGRGVPS